jgi:hypothetical protein
VCSDEVEIAAHSCILGGRSSVFKSMLTTEMSEKKTSRIVVDDIDSNTMQQFLRYIYKLEVEDLRNHAPNLIYCAEKYDLPQLKSMCVSRLIDEVSLKDVFLNLKIANRYNEPKLLRACMEFISM